MQHMDIGLIGLGVMGENLALNLERNGFSVCGFDLDAGKRKSFGERTQGLRAQAAPSLAALVDSLHSPRCIWLMVPAGAAVDEGLLPWPFCTVATARRCSNSSQRPPGSGSRHFDSVCACTPRLPLTPHPLRFALELVHAFPDQP
mgnify:CR=1 FL=1